MQNAGFFGSFDEESLNIGQKLLHIVFISEDPAIEMRDEVKIFCDVTFCRDFNQLKEINVFKKVDGICFDVKSLEPNRLDVLKRMLSRADFAHIPVLIFSKNLNDSLFACDLDLISSDFSQDYYFGDLNSKLFVMRLKNFIELYCLQKKQSRLINNENFDLALMAYYDKITNLPNRQLFQSRVEERMLNQDGGDFALMFLDLDGFKEVNDKNDHKAGDWLLNAVGVRLKSSLKRNDTVARLGGDEFGILLDRVISIHELEIIAYRIISRLSVPFNYNGVTLKVNASIGISIFPKHAKTYERLISLADHAMYTAKKNGKGQFAFAEPY